MQNFGAVTIRDWALVVRRAINGLESTDKKGIWESVRSDHGCKARVRELLVGQILNRFQCARWLTETAIP
jgi:hypothetical protein